MKTFQPTEKEIKREWHLVDAKGEVLGRLATKIATFLIGKHKSDYSAHMDSGDYVVVINAAKIMVTGKKASQKVYRSHSGYPGGFKEVSYEKMMTDFPDRIITHAVSGMLPKNRLRDKRLLRLKVFEGSKYPYEEKFKGIIKEVEVEEK
jgi:large subunit ribosomal protein L13